MTDDELCKALRTGRWVEVSYGNGNYMVSDQGEVYSKSRPKARARIMKPAVAVGGYPIVSLCQGSERKMFLVHRLVAEAFLGKRPQGCEIAHINGVPSDNRADNLCYKTRTENESDKAIHGTLLRGERTPSAKLNWEQVKEIREASLHQKVLAQKFGVARSTVQRIQSGEYWRAQQ
jgi:hypothetical protein